MKLKLYLTLAAVVFAGAFPTMAALITTSGTKPAVGNGNSGSPYEIWTAEELRWFVHYENTRHWYPDDYAKLMADIDLSSICGPDKGSWIPLGVAEESGAVGAFYGNFNGNGHTVSGMYIDGKDTDDIGSNAGFFGLMTGGSAYDLSVEGDIVNAYMPAYTGGMVAHIDTKSTAFSKDLNFSNCEARVGIWYEEKDGAPRTLYFTGRYVGGFAGHSSKTDVEITIDHCVFSGDINFDNASAYSAVGAFIGSIGNNKPTNLNYCSAATSLKLPFIQYVAESHGNLKLNLTGCVNRGPMAYKLDRMLFDTYFRFTNCIYSDRLCDVPTDDDNGHIVDTNSYRCDDPEMFTNGFACYKVNTLCGGNFFTQTLGTDKMPFPGSGHKTVYCVKEYTSCANDDFVYVYANRSTDITDKRQHTFAHDESLCTVCHTAVNPDYGIEKDAEGYYLAGSAEDIKWIWNLVNVTGMTGANIRLTADIDMEGEAMEPLARFSGIFDGQGHTLANVNISCTGTVGVGLVSNLFGTIRNLTLTGSVSATYMKYLGAFAGYAAIGSNITNVRNDCAVKVTGTMNGSMTMYVGGIAGYVDGSIAYAVNNGPVVDASVCTGSLTRYMAGVAGMVTLDNPHHLANNAVVGARSNAATAGTASAVANMLPSNVPSQFYYVSSISNPGLEYFFSDSPSTVTDTAVSPVDVGSGRLAWLLAGKDYDADDSATVFFGQTIGTDLVPYPFVNEEHKGVYNARHYYTCDSYSDYSNSSSDEEPLDHTWNANHYCSVCCVIDPAYMEQDPVTKTYLITDNDQYSTFVSALNAACNANKPMQYASASIQNDLDFSPDAPTVIDQLSGRIHGNGHKITIGSASSVSNIATTITKDGAIEYLDVALPSGDVYPMVDINHGRIVGCNVACGVPAAKSEGLVIDCYGEMASSKNLQGRYTRCLVKTYNNDGAESYRLYNSMVASNVDATYAEIPLEQGVTGELAYTLSHGSGNCEWGQELGTDSDPRIYFGQTPASDTYVTRLTSYAAAYPEGVVEYMNAGMGIEAAPGYYKVSEDAESWSTHPEHNFIIDNGDGTYIAEAIKLDAAAAHHLPIEVEAETFLYEDACEEGEFASLMFPIDIPVSKINGTVYIFDGYNTTDGQLEFVTSNELTVIPANVPFLVKSDQAGEILVDGSYREAYALLVSPMTGANAFARGDILHIASYHTENLPASETEDTVTTYFYTLSGTAVHQAASTVAPSRAAALTALIAEPVPAEGATVSPFAAYFALPASLVGATPESIPVTLKTEIITSVDKLAADTDGLFPCEVWNLRGIKQMKATSAADLRHLARGIYILVSGSESRMIAIR